jgi:hypothetical protein
MGGSGTLPEFLFRNRYFGIGSGLQVSQPGAGTPSSNGVEGVKAEPAETTTTTKKTSLSIFFFIFSPLGSKVSG